MLKFGYVCVFQGITCKYLYPWISVLEIPDAKVTAQEILENPIDFIALASGSIRYSLQLYERLISHIFRLIRRIFFPENVANVTLLLNTGI